MNRMMPTTIISVFPGLGKTFMAKQFPTMIRDLDPKEFRLSIKAPSVNGERAEDRIENPFWPNNYLESIRALDKSGMFKAVCVTMDPVVRTAMHEMRIKYTNIVPEDTPEMKKIMMNRYTEGNYPKEFIENMDMAWSLYIKGAIEDKGAVTTLQITPAILNSWYTWTLII